MSTTGIGTANVRTDIPLFIFDRTEALDPSARLNYQIVVNWLIAEHRTQGTMQLLMNMGDIERFWFFEANDPAQLERTAVLFERLAEPIFEQEGGS